MPRRRLGVALLLPPPVAGEVDVLRRAVGADDVERLPPHLTLVPPVNVRDDEMDAALDRLRDAASACGPCRLVLGPAATFLPVNPVLYLEVSGDVERVDRLRDRVFRPPLERPLTWPFQPHVTLLDGGDEDRVRAGVMALSSWRAEVVVERVHLLEETRRDEDGARVWRPIAEAALGGPAIVGRGGLELELEVGSMAGADAAGLAADRVVVTAPRDGRVVGLAEADVDGDTAQLLRLVVEEASRRQGIGRHLVAALSSALAARGVTVLVGRPSPELERLGFADGRRPL